MAATTTIPAQTLTQIGADLLQSAGVGIAEARLVAGTLVDADLRGHLSHGVNQIPGYLESLDRGDVRADGEITITNRGVGFAAIDGGLALGQVASKLAMDTAIELAAETTIGVVSLRRSSHYGAGGYWVQMAADADMIGFTTSNDATSTVAIHGGSRGALVNAAFSWAVPAGEEADIVIDMGTGAVADGKISLAKVLGERIPTGWAVDALGKATSDPDSVEAILPFGGPKGYAINVLCDVLAGVLGGSDASIVSAGRPPAEGGWANHFFLAFDIKSFLPLSEFKDGVDRQIRAIRASERAEGVERIYLPGERSGESRERGLRDGIQMPSAVLKRLCGVASGRGLAQVWVSQLAGSIN